MGQTCVFLARECPVGWFYRFTDDHLIQYGRLHAQSVCKWNDIVGLAKQSQLDLLRRLTCFNCSTAYCWGNFAGPFVVKEAEAPDYKGATIGLLVGYSIKWGCHLALLGK
jgi:hypothetical protein